MTSPATPRPEDENLGASANLAYGLQHVLTMYGGIVAVPLILGQAAGIAAADIGLLIAASLFAGGLATSADPGHPLLRLPAAVGSRGVLRRRGDHARDHRQ